MLFKIWQDVFALKWYLSRVVVLDLLTGDPPAEAGAAVAQCIAEVSRKSLANLGMFSRYCNASVASSVQEGSRNLATCRPDAWPRYRNACQDSNFLSGSEHPAPFSQGSQETRPALLCCFRCRQLLGASPKELQHDL